MQLSGGLDGGLDPPAYQRAEQKRMLANQAASENVSDLNLLSYEDGENGKYINALV